MFFFICALVATIAFLTWRLLRDRASRLDRDVLMHDLGRNRNYLNHGSE